MQACSHQSPVTSLPAGRQGHQSGVKTEASDLFLETRDKRLETNVNTARYSLC